MSPDPDPSITTRVLAFDEAAIVMAARAVLAGRPVAVPTETVYGLAADARSDAAVAAIFAAKQRPSFNPLIVHVSGFAEAIALGVFNKAAAALAEAHWPGPLTMVVPLRAGAGLSRLATSGLDTIAVRVPAHRAMRALLDATGRPLAAPSANASGGISPTTAAHVLQSLGGRVDIIIDDGPTGTGIESTIIAVDDRGVRVLRHGPITFHKGISVEPDAISAPGQLAAHYAPSKPLRLNVLQPEHDEFMIGFGDLAGTVNLSPAADMSEAAANLFAMLWLAETSPNARIAAAPVPERGVGVAINDRHRRAAHGTKALTPGR